MRTLAMLGARGVDELNRLHIHAACRRSSQGQLTG
jgi:hypothetical protein